MKQYQKINYKSDFACHIQFIIDGETTATPDFDFELNFSTGNKQYTIKQESGKQTNCIIDAEKNLIGQFLNHGLGRGVMLCEQVLKYPNDTYPNGVQEIHAVLNTGVILIKGVGDELTSCSVNCIVPNTDYNMLLNKPQINCVVLKGNKASSELDIIVAEDIEE